MRAIFLKEINGFFSSLTGYIVIAVFLVINSLFMWILPGEWNIIDSGYAGMEGLFNLSPWIFLFLVPAITMRMIAEEKRSGTIELIYTRPVTEREIVYAKYLSSMVLVFFSLLPFLITFFTVYLYGSPKGNLDIGGTIGSFIGLFLLAAVYAAIGIFVSSLSDNQVVAFVLSVLISFLMYTGFDSFSYLPSLKNIAEVVSGLGINEHYRSVSRGVIDLRDIMYYLAVTLIFTEAARLSLLSRKWKKKI